MKRPAATGLLIASFGLATMQSGRAADLFGLYLGGAVSQAHLEAAENVPDIVNNIVPGATSYSGAFGEHTTGFNVMAGIRPLPFLGAEVAYDDFGHGTGNYSNFFGGNQAENQATLSMKGESAFGVLYLPLPHLDLFAKAGVAVIKSSLTADAFHSSCPVYAPLCPGVILIGPITVDRTSTDLAAGAGVQLKLGSWAIRGEYEYFTAAGAHSALLSLGATWSFL